MKFNCTWTFGLREGAERECGEKKKKVQESEGGSKRKRAGKRQRHEGENQRRGNEK